MSSPVTPLPVGKTVRVGRKSCSDVVIDSALISSTHCSLIFHGHTDTGTTAVATVSDCSKNGTWIARGNVSHVNGSSSCKDPARKPSASSRIEKLPKGTPTDLHVGDIIMMLAPSHKQNAEHMYKLACDKDGNHFLKRMCYSQTGPSGGHTMAGTKRPAEDLDGGLSGSTKRPAGDLDGGHRAVTGTKRPAEETTDGSSSTKKARSDTVFLDEAASSTADHIETRTMSSEPEDKVRCPKCRKLFYISELPIHCPACQGAGMLKHKPELSPSEPNLPPEDNDSADMMEECPNCEKILPVTELPYHYETCVATESESMRGQSESYGECPYCFAVLPLTSLVEHCAGCGEEKSDRHTLSAGEGGAARIGKARHISSTVADVEVIEIDGRVKPEVSSVGAVVSLTGSALEVYASEGGEARASKGGEVCAGGSGDGRGAGGSGDGEVVELEQCAFCLEDFPLCEMPTHYSECSAKSSKKCEAEEHCQHCLKVFPLDQLINHSMTCSQRGKTLGNKSTGGGVMRDEETWGEPVERCMHCFNDFPLSKMVEHSNSCTGDALGARDRFKDFIPSVHDIDPMTLSVLTETQRKAVDYVRGKSRQDSEAVYHSLLKKVVHLGFTEKDLQETLHWICRDAPIIIHLKLDRCLRFLENDTHYRNLFETGKGGGGDCKRSRTDWENRIFNRIYDKDVSPFDRVKYGVLNIVGDPRGVQCCTSYGDSFLQLKKVRLRTTFASADTCHSTVKLSCCEHYGNVLHEYSNMELQAILDVATKRKSFLRSSVISNYKEVQIHGPVCLSENVDCIVVNERHESDPHMVRLLESFVEKNNCNLIWMEPAKSIEYPSFAHSNSTMHNSYHF